MIDALVRWLLLSAAILLFASCAYGQPRNLTVQKGTSSRFALVIGNDSYRQVEPLRNARADARAIAAALTGAGFVVTLQLDADQSAMKAAIRNFKSRIGGGDEAVFYYSGHGVQLGSTNYLLPVDIRGESEDQVKDDAVPLQRVLDDLQDQKARFALAIVDACRNNPFRQAGRALGGRGLAPTTAATGQMVIYSAGTGQQALDRLGENDRNQNGLFTRVFLREMEKPGVPVDRVLRSVRDEVVRLAKSVGHEQVPALYDQALGEFYFRPGNASQISTTTVPGTAIDPSANDRALWDSVKDSRNPEELQAYLNQFPQGVFAGIAATRLKALQIAVNSPSAQVVPSTPPVQIATIAPGNNVARPVEGNANAAADRITRAMASAASSSGFTPQVGQEGKDVIWVPTPMALIEQMLAATNPTGNDIVVDLGSGDGRIPLYAALRFGVRAIGIEYDAKLVRLSQDAASRLGLGDRVQFVAGDIFQIDFNNATIVTTYLLPALMTKLKPKLMAMRPGTRIVSHAFTGDWIPDRSISVEGRSAYLWTIPSKSGMRMSPKTRGDMAQGLEKFFKGTPNVKIAMYSDSKLISNSGVQFKALLEHTR